MIESYELKKKRKIASDGEHVVVPLSLMDARAIADRAIREVNTPVLHKPGYLPLTDEQKAEKATHHNGYNERISSAWKNPPAVLPQHLNEPAKLAAPGDAKTAYANYDRKVADRWRGAA